MYIRISSSYVAMHMNYGVNFEVCVTLKPFVCSYCGKGYSPTITSKNILKMNIMLASPSDKTIPLSYV